MKKIIPILMFVICMFSACETTSSDNGELDAMWYLVKVDTLSTGNSAEYRSQRIFWSFQGSLMQMNCVDHLDTRYMGRFEHTGNLLRVYSVFRYDRMNGDSILGNERIHEVGVYGVNCVDDTFDVETLSGDEMVLKDRKLRLSFERY